MSEKKSRISVHGRYCVTISLEDTILAQDGQDPERLIKGGAPGYPPFVSGSGVDLNCALDAALIALGKVALGRLTDGSLDLARAKKK